MRLEARGSQTFLEYHGQAQVGGRIASVGQRLMDSAARSIIRQSLEALNKYLAIQAAQQAPPASAAPAASAKGVAEVPVVTAAVSTGEYKPPTQTMLMVRVARDVLRDFIPVKYQPWVLGGATVIIVLLILLATRQ
jgi:hypothetical protein